MRRVLLADGIRADQIHHSDTFVTDAVNCLKVYPANYFRAVAHARRDHFVDVPVQLIVNMKDPYVRPHGYDDTSRWVSRLWRRDIKAGHWSPMSHPQVLAAATAELADFVDGEPARRGLRRAEVGRRREHFGDTLVSVTGAGSGIGRETALAFAREGAELVVSDIDEASVKETAALISACGADAHVYTLDVSDADAVERFAKRSAPPTGCLTSWSTMPASGTPGGFWTPPPSSSTGCSTSTSVASSTAAGHSPSGSSSVAPGDTSSTSPRWRPTRRRRR
jgi:hypothetical protein